MRHGRTSASSFLSSFFPLLKPLITMLSIVLANEALAGLVLNPQRIVLQDRERSASLDLLNTGETTGRYQIYFEHKYMKEDGSIVDIENPEAGGPYAGDMIRYSPRRVDIPAGGTQTIRLAVRRPKGLSEGEYLSHLVMKQIPNRTVTNTDETIEGEKERQLNLAVQPILKLAIPVIVRKGSSNTQASISDLQPIERDGKVSTLHFTLHRQGNFSLYGNVEVFEQNGSELGDRIGFIRGIALYTPTSKRLVKVQLSKALDTSGKQYLVRFKEDPKFGGNNLVEQVVSF